MGLGQGVDAVKGVSSGWHGLPTQVKINFLERRTKGKTSATEKTNKQEENKRTTRTSKITRSVKDSGYNWAKTVLHLNQVTQTMTFITIYSILTPSYFCREELQKL